MSSQKSNQISLAAAVVGLITAILGLVTWWPDRDPDPPDPTEDPVPECDVSQRAPQLHLSDGRGPSGTELTISGTDFCPQVRVQLRFHVEDIQVAETDADGAFSVDARVPGTYDAFAPDQYDIIATGERVRAETPFELTAPDDPAPTEDSAERCRWVDHSPQLHLSDGRGPSGTELTISGTDFCPQVRVEISFHVDQIEVAETDADGAFSVDARVPGTHDPFAPQQYDIRASGKYLSADTPFQLTVE